MPMGDGDREENSLIPSFGLIYLKGVLMGVKTSLLRVALCVVLLWFGMASAWAQTAVVVPGANTNVEGNTDNGYPYNIAAFGFTAQRYQQIYAASEFAGKSGTITQIRYRPDAFFQPAFAMTLPKSKSFFP